MRLSHPDYIKLVIETYHKKRVNNELSLLLAQPTPASLRKECVIVYQERYERRDENALRGFFEPGDQEKKLLDIIQECELKKFKPLVSYLKRADKKGVNDTNLELLAWLINFRHRPHIVGKEILLNDEELALLAKPIDIGKNHPENEPEEDNPEETVEVAGATGAGSEPIGGIVVKGKAQGSNGDQIPMQAISADKKQKEKSKRAAIIFLILIICMGGVYMLWQENRRKQVAYGNTNTGCMYWKDDHYEETPCNDRRTDIFKLPMDSEKMKNFKRIMREDTITEKSIGKVYYIRIDKRIEYYTAGGNHPIDVTRPLKPLSPYMFEKHLLKQENTNKVSAAE